MKMNKKAAERWNRFTVESNERFRKMTPSQKRVALAEDVIAQLMIKAFTPELSNCYVDLHDEKLSAADKKELVGQDLSVVIPQLNGCDVCAVGALFACNVVRADALTTGQFTGSETVFSYLDDLFGYYQRSLIEWAFESWSGPWLDNEPDEYPGASLFSPTERLVLIMKDIVEGDGTFDPVRFNKTVEGILEKKLKTKDPHAQP